MTTKKAAAAKAPEFTKADLELVSDNPLDAIEAEVAELERLRKRDPGSFYFAAPRANSKGQIGPNRARTEELQGRLKGFVGRLEKLR